MSYFPGMTREQELGFLKEEADAVRQHLEDLEVRIKELETKEK
jgi:ubiquinone biosynthesis protein UbiJ